MPHQSNKILKHTAENLILNINAKTGEISNASPNALEMLGLAISESKSKNYFKLLSERADNLLPSRECLVALSNDTSAAHCSFSYLEQDLSPIKWTVFYIKAIQEYILTGIDNSQAKKISSRNSELQLYLDNILNQIPGYLYWKDKNSVYLGCNANFAKVAGLNSPQEIIGKSDYDLIWGETEAELFRSGDKDALAGIKKLDFEEPQLQADGRYATVLASKVPLLDSNKDVIGVLGVYTDITARKKTEQELAIAKIKAEAASKGLALVAASIAHELRTPLLAISTSMNVIINSFKDLLEAYEKAKENNLPVKFIPPARLNSLKSIASEIENEVTFSNLIIDMLLVKIKQPDYKSEFQVYSMASCVTKAISRYPFTPKQRKMLDIDIKKDFKFSGNEIFITHVFFNLLKNAIYYTENKVNGKIQIWFDSNDLYNIVLFKDTGKGISADILPHIFDRFYSKTQGGTGVGLAFCKTVMEEMGGSIVCESKEGEHTIFSLFFPNNY